MLRLQLTLWLDLPTRYPALQPRVRLHGSAFNEHIKEPENALQRDLFRMTQETLLRMILKTLPIKVMNHFRK